jgi:hypothetical protein
MKNVSLCFCLICFISVSTYSFADGYYGSTKDSFTNVNGCLDDGKKGYGALGVIVGTYFGMRDIVFYDKPGGTKRDIPSDAPGVIHSGVGDSMYYPIFCGREKGYLKVGNAWVSEKDLEHEIVPINKWIERLGKYNYISSPTQIITDKGKITVEKGYFSISGDGCTADGYCPVNYWETKQPHCTESIIKEPVKYSGKMRIFDSDYIPLFHDDVDDNSYVCEVKLLEDTELNRENGSKVLLKKESSLFVVCWKDSCTVYEYGEMWDSVGDFSPYNKEGDVIIELITPDADFFSC